MQRITAANTELSGPTNHSDQAVWFIAGAAYVADGHPFVAYVERRGGYTVEHVDAAPPEWTAALDALKATGSFRIGGPTTDAAAQGQAHMPIPHRPDCPACDDLLGPGVDAWQTRKGGARRGAQTR
ncbi:hypothetical protein [Micromonospora sp. NPDC005367]|uniref:hypothetical protein n=1 Tax=Micromonospora sp. NPDC005367 TaxID=3155590 RepID=UPI0033A9448E